MNRRNALCLVSALIALSGGCGRSALDLLGARGANGEGSSATGSGGSGGATTTGTGAGGDAGGTCNEPPPPSPIQPSQPGCYENPGSGWIPVPCSCDLWMPNTTFDSIPAILLLTVTPPDQVVSLDGPLEVGIAFDDPDASWYATWAKQQGNGVAFMVTNEGATTTLKMGEGSLVMGPVRIPACTTRKAVAHLTGSNYMAKLGIHAILGDGSVVTTTDATCSNPPPT